MKKQRIYIDTSVVGGCLDAKFSSESSALFEMARAGSLSKGNRLTMNDNEPFDCVEMKNRIQAKLLREYDGLTPEQERRRRIQKLATADSLAARIWQTARKQQETISK